MPVRIGLLLPRSTDYPAMGFDILDGLRTHLHLLGILDPQLITENIGFGDDQQLSYAKAEKLLLQDDVQLLIAYSNIQNAEPLYQMAQSSGRAFLFLDTGMQTATIDKIPNNWFLNLQGIDTCFRLGQLAGEGERNVMMANSFFDAGYRGSLFATKGLDLTGGAVSGNYVSTHKISEFTIDRYLELLNENEPQAVIANFSIYLTDLFLKELKNKGESATPFPFYCSPFMAEETLLTKCDFPTGTFHTIVPWSSSVENEAQHLFLTTIREQKNKTANLFHLLGWEAAIAVNHLLNNGPQSLANWSFESPRGKVTFDSVTQSSYAPLYKGIIVPDIDGKCVLEIEEKLEVTKEEHQQNWTQKQEEMSSGWKNNFLCT
ncbi:ABC transporter substrate-binding protein [Flavobacterium aquicola]|uniref:Amino acid/amide ABC transporter substrate-binding protein (HAAT family) n=1 Tax=Flavobacterium aquicola TaxID=1682742 RepID=A0A3E0E0Q2_9FLAO|nr:ABC transporter substrate-binding protein [Flavobacterium aquicola]REG90476.1 amino acid/amide ABC transporter substrate-binding protein (HAAT family) [Flavobacterium aquicola]